MRKIKFRAWYDNEIDEFMVKNIKLVNNIVDDKHLTFMQYTGVKDKNDVEIYEGDIIKIDEVLDVKNYITQVIFRDSAFRYVHQDGSAGVLPKHTRKVKGYETITKDIEVIGNIYENKDLIKTEEIKDEN